MVITAFGSHSPVRIRSAKDGLSFWSLSRSAFSSARCWGVFVFARKTRCAFMTSSVSSCPWAEARPRLTLSKPPGKGVGKHPRALHRTGLANGVQGSRDGFEHGRAEPTEQLL